MELPNIGQQCSVENCKQLDYLPLQCECKLFFCRDHFAKHVENCSQIKKNEQLNHNENVSAFICSKPGCEEKSIIPLICDKCNQHYCITHRHIAGICNALDENQLKEIKAKFDAPRKQFQEAKYLVDQQINDNINKAIRNTKNSNIANKVQLMRIKSKATGLKHIPTEDRIYFLIFNSKYCPEGKSVFVSKTWTIGKTIDAIAEECKIPNNNHQLLSPKLRLISKHNNEIITENMATNMDNFLNSSILINGDSLILDYVTNAV